MQAKYKVFSYKLWLFVVVRRKAKMMIIKKVKKRNPTKSIRSLSMTKTNHRRPDTNPGMYCM